MRYLITCLFCCSQLLLSAQTNKADKEFKEAVGKWFNAWELVYQQVYQMKTFLPVDFVFYDEKYVYSTSAVTVPKGQVVAGPSLKQQKLQWKKALHNGSLVLPNKDTLPLNIYSYASVADTAKLTTFFIMPLPSFWQQAGVESKELGLENLLTGVFLHEFSHCQQMKSFGRKITQLEKQIPAQYELSDDLIQHIFASNEKYLGIYRVELTFLDQQPITSDNIEGALKTIQFRRQQFFKDSFEVFQQLDPLFLTMEGLGQYSMYVWLIHPQGANLTKETAIAGVRRNRKWWSQDEGFSLFLMLETLAPAKDWSNFVLGEQMMTVEELIKNYLSFKH